MFPNGGEKWWFTMVESETYPQTNPRSNLGKTSNLIKYLPGMAFSSHEFFLGVNPHDQILWIFCKLGGFSHQNGPNLKWKIQTIISGHSITNANFMPPCSVEIPQNYEQNLHQIRKFSQKTAPIKWHVTYLSLVFFVNQFHFVAIPLLNHHLA